VALAASAERYRLLAEHTSDMLYLYRLLPAPGCEYVSPSSLPILGYSADQFYADPELILRLIHPDDRHLLTEVAPAAGGRQHAVLSRWIRRDGSTAWLEMHTTAVRDEAGRVVAVDGVARDVTGRKTVEDELRRANRAMQALIEASPLPIVSVDVENVVTGWNPAAERLFGWRADEVVGQSLPTIPPEARESAAAVWHRVMEGDAFVSVEAVRMRRDGSRLDVSVAYGPVHDSRGHVTGFMAILEDVTEAKRTREALTVSEHRFRELADSLPQTVYETDEHHRLTFANRGARLAFGFADGEPLIGLSILDLVAPDQRPKAMEHVRRILAGEKLGASEYTAVRRDGSTFAIAAHSTAIMRNGKPIGLRGVIFDITERIRAEQALRDSEAKLRALFNGASDAIFVHHQEEGGPAGEFVEVNDAACAWLGYGRDELLSLRPDDIDADAGGTRLEAARDDAGAGRVQYETVLVTKDGRQLPAEIISHVFYLNGERLILAIARDTSERMRARIKEARYVRELALLSDTAMGFVQLPPDQDIYALIADKTVELAGEAVVVVAELEPGSDRLVVRAVAAAEPLSPLPAEPAAAAVRAVASDGAVLESLARGQPVILTADDAARPQLRPLWTNAGTPWPLERAYVQGFVHQGRLLGLALVLMHDTDDRSHADVLATFANQASVALQRKQIEQALQETYAQNRQLLASIASALIGIDAAKRVTHWNHAAEIITGLPATTAVGRPLSDCGVGWDWASIGASIDECLSARASCRPETCTTAGRTAGRA
jgi:PAS domain S-box-containing protein